MAFNGARAPSKKRAAFCGRRAIQRRFARAVERDARAEPVASSSETEWRRGVSSGVATGHVWPSTDGPCAEGGGAAGKRDHMHGTPAMRRPAVRPAAAPTCAPDGRPVAVARRLPPRCASMGAGFAAGSGFQLVPPGLTFTGGSVFTSGRLGGAGASAAVVARSAAGAAGEGAATGGGRRFGGSSSRHPATATPSSAAETSAIQRVRDAVTSSPDRSASACRSRASEAGGCRTRSPTSRCRPRSSGSTCTGSPERPAG